MSKRRITASGAIKAEVKKIKKRDGWSWDLTAGGIEFALGKMLAFENEEWYHVRNRKLLRKRVLKKLRQPYKKNMNRKRMKRRAAGKNNHHARLSAR